MLVFFLAVVGGLVVLSWSADRFVVGASSLASRFGVSPVVIGALVVGCGTSLPEALVSGLAAGRGETDIGIGNIVGSNAANLTLILGAAAVITALHVGRGVLRKEVPLVLAATAVFAVLVQGGLERWEGGALAASFVVAAALLLRGSRVPAGAVAAAGPPPVPGTARSAAEDDAELAREVEEFLDVELSAMHVTPPPASTARLVALTLVGLVGTLAGAQALVWGAVGIADELGWSGGLVGVTLVAVGTSLPELVTSVQAARLGEGELIIGNLLGSNLFNALLVGAIVGLVGPGPVDAGLSGGAVAVMAAVTVAAVVAMRTGLRVTRREGVALAVAYLAIVPVVA